MFLTNKLVNKAKYLTENFKRIITNKIVYKENSFVLQSNNWITKYRFVSFSDKEPETLDWIDNNIKENDVFFDVGANIGIYSLYTASKKLKNCRIFSFEPEYSNLNEFKFNIIKNKFNNIIQTYSLAFGSFNHVSHLNINDVTPGAALHKLNNKKSEKAKIVEGIYVMKIDSFCEQLEIYPSIIKIDIDGNEIDFLMGAQNMLKNNKLRSLIIELDNRFEREDCIKLIEKTGLKLVNSFEKNSTYIFSRKI